METLTCLFQMASSRQTSHGRVTSQSPMCLRMKIMNEEGKLLCYKTLLWFLSQSDIASSLKSQVRLRGVGPTEDTLLMGNPSATSVGATSI